MQRDVNYDGQVMLSIWNQFVRLALSAEHFCEQKSHRTIDNKIGKHSEERTKILNLIKKRQTSIRAGKDLITLMDDGIAWE